MCVCNRFFSFYIILRELIGLKLLKISRNLVCNLKFLIFLFSPSFVVCLMPEPTETLSFRYWCLELKALEWKSLHRSFFSRKLKAFPCWTFDKDHCWSNSSQKIRNRVSRDATSLTIPNASSSQSLVIVSMFKHFKYCQSYFDSFFDPKSVTHHANARSIKMKISR